MTKMTERKAWTMVIAETTSDELKAFAENKIKAIDARNASKKKSPKELARRAELAALDEQVYSLIIEPRAYTAKEIGEVLGESTPKATASCKRLVAEGKLAAEDIIANGRVVKGYKRV